MAIPTWQGGYLAPPFAYNTCLDRDSDGLLRTSSALGDILAWTNDAGADTEGGVTTAEDECIINYVRVAPSLTRTIAIDGAERCLGRRDGRHGPREARRRYRPAGCRNEAQLRAAADMAA